MPITRAPQKAISWPPNPSLQHLRHVYRVKPDDTFASIARKENIDVWTLISFNFQTTNPAEVNWYLQKDLHCTKQTHDGKNYRFSGGEQIYIPDVPTPECGAWPYRSAWSSNYIVQYQRFVQETAQSYVGRSDYTRDCADFATDVLVDFAARNGLPLALYSLKHRRLTHNWAEGWSCTQIQNQLDVDLPEYDLHFTLHDIEAPNYRRFAADARFYLNADDLYDIRLGNTIPISRAQLKPGDLLILPPPYTTHVQVVLSPTGSIFVDGQTRRVLFIVQGNTADRDLVGLSSGKPIALKAWDLSDPTRYYVNVNRTWRDNPEAEVQLSNFQPRRWNFEMFNRAYGMPPP